MQGQRLHRGEILVLGTCPVRPRFDARATDAHAGRVLRRWASRLLTIAGL